MFFYKFCLKFHLVKFLVLLRVYGLSNVFFSLKITLDLMKALSKKYKPIFFELKLFYLTFEIL